MSDYRDQLIELYKTTLEEARHHDTINMQMFMALSVVISLLLVAVSLLFGKDSPVPPEYFTLVKVGILVLFGAGEGLFYQAFCRMHRHFWVCGKVSEKIGEKLKKLANDQNTKGAFNLNGLLVHEELRKSGEGEKICNEEWKWYRRPRLIVYGVAAIIAFVALGLLLFVVIDV